MCTVCGVVGIDKFITGHSVFAVGDHIMCKIHRS